MTASTPTHSHDGWLPDQLPLARHILIVFTLGTQFEAKHCMHRNCGRFYRHWGNHTNYRPRENWGIVNPCERGVRVLQLKYRGGCAQSTFLSCSRMRQYVIKCCSSEMKRVCLELKCGKDFYTSILYTPQREPRKRLTQSQCALLTKC